MHGIIILCKFGEKIKEHIGLNNTGVVKSIYTARNYLVMHSFKKEIKEWKRAKVKSNTAQTQTFSPETQETVPSLWIKTADCLSWKDYTTVAQQLLSSSSSPPFKGTGLLRPWSAIKAHVAAKSWGFTHTTTTNLALDFTNSWIYLVRSGSNKKMHDSSPVSAAIELICDPFVFWMFSTIVVSKCYFLSPHRYCRM